MVGGTLVLGSLAHQTLTVSGKGHHRRGELVAKDIRDHHRLASFQHSNAGIGRTQVDADGLAGVALLRLGSGFGLRRSLRLGSGFGLRRSLRLRRSLGLRGSLGSIFLGRSRRRGRGYSLRHFHSLANGKANGIFHPLVVGFLLVVEFLGSTLAGMAQNQFTESGQPTACFSLCDTINSGSGSPLAIGFLANAHFEQVVAFARQINHDMAAVKQCFLHDHMLKVACFVSLMTDQNAGDLVAEHAAFPHLVQGNFHAQAQIMAGSGDGALEILQVEGLSNIFGAINGLGM